MNDKNLSYKNNANLKSKRHLLCSKNVAKRFTSYLWSKVDVWYCEPLYVLLRWKSIPGIHRNDQCFEVRLLMLLNIGFSKQLCFEPLWGTMRFLLGIQLLLTAIATLSTGHLIIMSPDNVSFIMNTV